MAKTSKKSSTSSGSSQSHIGVITLAHGHYIRSWQIVVFIVLVMFAGIIIIRLSHAATSEVVSTPLNESEIEQLTVSGNALATDSTAGADMQTGQSQAAAAIPVSGTALFSYTPVGVANVEKVGFYLDGKLTSVGTKRPYNFTFESARYANGSYSLTAVAFDKDNKPLSAVKKTLAVDNSPSAWQQLQNWVSYPFYVLTTKP